MSRNFGAVIGEGCWTTRSGRSRGREGRLLHRHDVASLDRGQDLVLRSEVAEGWGWHCDLGSVHPVWMCGCGRGHGNVAVAACLLKMLCVGGGFRMDLLVVEVAALRMWATGEPVYGVIGTCLPRLVVCHCCVSCCVACRLR
jgi:hypothetical protein